MSDYDDINISENSVSDIFYAAAEAGESEIEKIISKIIEALRQISPPRHFENINARNFWDEFCWLLENSYSFTLIKQFELQIEYIIEDELDKLPSHIKIFITAYCFEDYDADDYELGAIATYKIKQTILEHIEELASGRNLEAIGEFRGDIIYTAITNHSLCCNVLGDSDLLSDVIDDNLDLIIDPDYVLSDMADQITKHFIDYLYCIEELPFGVEDFFNQYRDKLFLTIKNDDVLPGLKAARKEILEDLDSDIKETSIAISCQQAVEIAASDARANQIGYGVSKICLFEEITEREPVLYDVKMEGNWIAYIDTNLHYIGSSTIVVVDSKTGDVLHRGSAGNEG